MKKIHIAVLTGTLSVGTAMLFAQESPQQNPEPPHHPRGHHRPPPPPPGPLLITLDANKDGALDADEIANASPALLKLDKNQDGQLTREELRPPRPHHDGPPRHAEGHDPAPFRDQ